MGAIDLNGPGRFFHWSFITISLSNLVLIAVMVVIFGAALLIPFPYGSDSHIAAETDGSGDSDKAPGSGDEADASMWTSRIRRKALELLPPGKLLPDRQPAYVASWVYVFGVATLAALGVAIVSGFAIALGGVDWWHSNPVGHFFNSLHLWSVEIFMAFMVIHLWGKFWMAAWRGKRGRTWITGVLAFLAAVGMCFTGYLSQQNFDSQWIATNGKDAFNSVGIGSFFNLMNFGQMLLWHVVLLPIVLVALVGAHILLVRMRGVVHPLPSGAREAKGPREKRLVRAAEAADWKGATRRYDIVKEASIATCVVLVLTIVLSAILSSPDIPPVDMHTWAVAAPADLLGTTASELAGTSETATYGPPYNNASGSVQQIGISWQKLAGVREPISAAKAFVLEPLSKASATDPSLKQALKRYESASRSQQVAWADSYTKALEKVRFVNDSPVVPRADDGPVPVMASAELTLARAGALDADLIANKKFYGTDFTKPLLFLEDGSYFAARAQADHLLGDQWGVMNETGSYPGQPWLWLYQMWYHVPGFESSANVDMIAIYLTGAATLLLLLVPFIPGLRDLPRWIPLHRLVWRDQKAPQAVQD